MSLTLTLRSDSGTRPLTADRRHTLTLELTVPSSPPAIVPGASVPEEQAKTSETPRLYLIFGTLMDAKALEDLSIAASGWVATRFDNPTPCWALTRDGSLPLAGGEAIPVTISNVVCHESQDGQLVVDYYNFGVSDGSVGLPISVRRSSDRDLNLDVRLVDPAAVVFVTRPGEPPIFNSVSLTISNPSPTEPLARKGATRSQNAPSFRIWVAFGDAPGYGALTTRQKAADIRLETDAYKEAYAGLWSTSGDAVADPPYVELKALPENTDVLGAGAGGTVQLTLNNIVTELDPGVAQIYVEWRDIPGCRNGSTAVPIRKVGKTRIVAFDADRTIVDFGKPQNITFPCEIQQATLVKLNGRTVGTADVPRTMKLAPTLDLSAATDVTLVAYGAGPDNVTTQPLRVRSVGEYVTGKTFRAAASAVLTIDDIGGSGILSPDGGGGPSGPADFHYRLTETIAFTADHATYSAEVEGVCVTRDVPRVQRSAAGGRTVTGPWRVSDGRIYLSDATSALEIPSAFEERDHTGIIGIEKDGFVGAIVWGSGAFIPVPTLKMAP